MDGRWMRHRYHPLSAPPFIRAISQIAPVSFSFGRLTVVSGGVGQPASLLLFLFVGWMGAARKGEEVEVRRRERKKERKENHIVQVQPPWKQKGKHFVYSGPKP